MTKRHLAPPVNRVKGFACVSLFLLLPLLRLEFSRELTERHDHWRAGKTQVKLQKVDTSIAEDKVVCERVRFMLKCEISRWPYYAEQAVSKARGIQFSVNEATSYTWANHYAAFSSALATASSREQVIEGIGFTMVYSSKMAHEDISRFATESELLRKQYPDSVIDERDGKNWDANVQKCHREALCQIYAELSAELANHARRGIKVKGAVAIDGHRIWYTVDGTVKSGHPDTSSGNGALNREVSIQAILSLPRHLRPVKVRGLIMGDDYLAWLYFGHTVDYTELARALDGCEANLGIVPERGLFTDIRHASFISLAFYRGVRGGVVALPKIGRLLSGLFWTVTPLQNRDPRRLASGIAQAFYPLFNTCDFMRQFLSHHMRVAPIDGSSFIHFYQWAEIGLKRLPEPIHWRDEHLWKYGPDVALLHFSLPEDFAGLCQHPVVDLIIRSDLADPRDRLGCVSRH